MRNSSSVPLISNTTEFTEICYSSVRWARCSKDYLARRSHLLSFPHRAEKTKSNESKDSYNPAVVTKRGIALTRRARERAPGGPFVAVRWRLRRPRRRGSRRWCLSLDPLAFLRTSQLHPRPG